VSLLVQADEIAEAYNVRKDYFAKWTRQQIVKLLAGRGGGGAASEPPQLVSLPEPPVATTPASLAETLDGIVKIISHRVVCPVEITWGIVLWIAATWGVRGPDELDGPDLFPRLVVRSATPRCGKTLLLEIVLYLSAKPFSAENATPAVVFRLTEMVRPTWIIDEADRFLRKNDELQGVVNSGYRRNGCVARTVEIVGRGDDGRPVKTFEVRRFSTFAAMAIAGIGRLLDTIEDRSIRVVLKRQPAPRRRSKRIGLRELGRLRTFIGGSLSAHGDAMATAMAARCNDNDFPEWLNDRDADNWGPLIAVARLAGDPWPGRVQAAMRGLCEGAEAAAEQSEGERLLADVYEYARERRLAVVREYLKWRKNGRPAPPSKAPAYSKKAAPPRRYGFILSDDLARWLAAKDDSPGAATGASLDLGPAKLMIATMLRPFGVAPCQRRYAGRPERGYAISQFRPIWNTYNIWRASISEELVEDEGGGGHAEGSPLRI
jgi:hypothetical protein